MIPHHGQVFAFFVIAVAAAEAAVGLAIVLALYRVRKVVRTDDWDFAFGFTDLESWPHSTGANATG